MLGQGGGRPQDRCRVEPHHRFQAMALRPQDRRHHGAQRCDLEDALGEVRCCLLAENPLGAGGWRDLAELGLERLAGPYQAVLHHVADDRRNRQHQQRHADRRNDGIFERGRQRQKPGSVAADHPGIGDQIAHRHQDAVADRSGERRQQQRRARDHEPGVDFLAFGDVAPLKRLVETFLRRVFCLV